MIDWFHPGLIYILGAFLIPLFRGTIKKGYLLLLPVLALINLLLMSRGVFSPEEKEWIIPFLGFDLILGRVCKVGMVVGYFFGISWCISSVGSACWEVSSYICNRPDPLPLRLFHGDGD